MEMYRYPYTAETLHHAYSCTKSFTSALIGIAIAQERIKDTSQRLTDFFSDRQIANLDEAKLAQRLKSDWMENTAPQILSRVSGTRISLEPRGIWDAAVGRMTGISLSSISYSEMRAGLPTLSISREMS